jgi:hypothetical protein
VISSSKTLLSMAENLGDYRNKSEGRNSTDTKKKFLNLQLAAQATKQANRDPKGSSLIKVIDVRI